MIISLRRVCPACGSRRVTRMERIYVCNRCSIAFHGTKIGFVRFAYHTSLQSLLNFFR